MINLWDHIKAEAVPVTWTPKGEGDYNSDGDFVPASTVATSILAVVQPATGNKLTDLPEGIRTEAQYLLWTDQPVDEDDEITHSDTTYRILYLWPRSAEGGFRRAAMGRKRD